MNEKTNWLLPLVTYYFRQQFNAFDGDGFDRYVRVSADIASRAHPNLLYHLHAAKHFAKHAVANLFWIWAGKI